jgi:hypothetical protein
VDAIADEEVVASIEDVTYRPSRELPPARRFRLVRPFKSVIGTSTYDFPRGMVFDRNLHGVELLEKLYERHAALVALPD